MKKFFLSALLFSCFYPLNGQAASVQNSDARSYTLQVSKDSHSYQVAIEPNGTIIDLCSACTIEVVGFGLLDVENEKFLVIKDGLLSLKN